MTLEDLPPLRDSLAEHGLLARKALGQHFLLDLNITRKIARLAEVAENDMVIEVGPGPGGLTRALIEAGARVIAVETDARFLPLLAELGAAADGRLTVVHADALKIDTSALLRQAGATTAAVVANLPYNIGTPLLVGWLSGAFTPSAMTLMFQKEVAQRIVATPAADAYGRLAVIAQACCEARLVMEVPARAFTPPPRVDSAVVRLIPRASRPIGSKLAALERVTQAAFGQRRKMLRSSLKALGGEALCERAGIDANVRAEVIDVAGFLQLSEALD